LGRGLQNKKEDIGKRGKRMQEMEMEEREKIEKRGRKGTTFHTDTSFSRFQSSNP